MQIYPSLRRLQQAGLITGADDPRGRRRRRVYEITGAGEAALRQWLRRTEPMPFELRDIGLVRLFFADALTPGEASELLTRPLAFMTRAGDGIGVRLVRSSL